MAVTDPVPRPRGYVTGRFQRDGCGYRADPQNTRNYRFRQRKGARAGQVGMVPVRFTREYRYCPCTKKTGDILDHGCARSI
jgi:hypothetical protein